MMDVFRDPKKDSRKRSENVIIVVKNDELKGFRVLLPRNRIFITTRHVRPVKILLTLTLSTWRRYDVQRLRLSWNS